MRIKQTEVFTFKELSEEAKQKALEKLYDINVNFDWWEFIYEDAENIGIEINGFDIDRGSYCEIKIDTSAPEVIESILKEHGKTCETYKTAKRYEAIFKELETLRDNEDPSFEDKFAEEEKNFSHDIGEDYLQNLRKEYEYMTSKEAIIETIEANEYEFTIDGKLA